MLRHQRADAKRNEDASYWYGDFDLIEVYIDTPDGSHGCTILRKDLIRWFEATTK